MSAPFIQFCSFVYFIYLYVSENNMLGGFVWIHSDSCGQTNKYIPLTNLFFNTITNLFFSFSFPSFCSYRVMLWELLIQQTPYNFIEMHY